MTEQQPIPACPTCGVPGTRILATLRHIRLHFVWCKRCDKTSPVPFAGEPEPPAGP
jgi:hypothetical protein